MALIECLECSKQVSSIAISCPCCGAPVSDLVAERNADSSTGLLGTLFTLTMLGLLGSIAWFVFLCRNGMPRAMGEPSLESLWNLFYGISPVATITLLVSVALGAVIHQIIVSSKKS